MNPSNRLFRIGFPQVVLVVGTLLFIAVRNWPRGNVETQVLNMSAYAIVMLTGSLLIGWLYFARPIHRMYSIGLFAGATATFFGGLASGAIQFDGDLGILLKNPFHDPTSVIEAHRRTQNDENSAKVDLKPEQPHDSPAFRGRDRTGVIDGPTLNHDWEAKPPQLVWRQPIGEGYGGFAGVNGYLVTLEQRRDDEVLACYDARDGREVWKYNYPAAFREKMGGNGPRTTPTIHGGLVYSLGATGTLICVDGRNGSLRWRVNILDGTPNLSWGMSGSPLVFEDIVIVNPGQNPAKPEPSAVRAYDRLTGKERWRTGKSRAGYSSPMLVELDGVQQVLLFDGDGLAGYDPKAGKELWRFPWDTNQGINVAQPVVVGNEQIVANLAGTGLVFGAAPKLPPARQVFIASGYGTGGALIEVRKDGESWKSRQVWRTKAVTMRCKFTSPVKWHGCLIGLNDGILESVNLHDGRSLWKDDRRARVGEAYGHGQILRTGNDILILTEFGEIVRVEASVDGLIERSRIEAVRGLKTWNTPTLIDGYLYVRNAEEMACYDLRP